MDLMPVSPPLIAVTIGDPAGIGPEIVARAVADSSVRESASPLVIGDRTRLAEAARICGIGPPMAYGVPLIDLANVPPDLAWGRIQTEAGRAAGQYIERAVDEALAGRVQAVATAPLNKEALWEARYPYPGHTEMFGALCGVADPLTMFQVRGMRIFFLSRHLPLREAIGWVTRERIAEMLPRIAGELQGLGIERPRIAVAGLNPHAGEGGAMGREDQDEIAPAVADARNAGLTVTGPVPADSVFAHALEGRYDAVLSLFHDQGHIAAKTVDFHGTVSVTLGLPFIRTSVDHGTAFDIAGRGVARADSMAAAIIAAADLVRRRNAVARR